MSQTIVALTPNHIGDVLFTEPALAALRTKFPTARLVVVTSPEARAVLEHHPAIDELWVRERNLKGWWRLVTRLRGYRPKLVVSFSPSSLGLALASFFSGAPNRYGFAFRPLVTALFTKALPLRKERHVVEDNLSLVDEASETRRIPQVFIQPAEREWGWEWLRSQGWDGKTMLLGCHPFSSVTRKEWSLDKFRTLLRWAREERGWLPIVFGSPTERERAEALRDIGVLFAVGALNLRQFIAVVGWCQCFLGGDSGPVHIAAALGVPTIALFGPTDPRRTGPLGERVQILSSPTCNIDDIDVAQVKEALVKAEEWAQAL